MKRLTRSQFTDAKGSIRPSVNSVRSEWKAGGISCEIVVWGAVEKARPL